MVLYYFVKFLNIINNYIIYINKKLIICYIDSIRGVKINKIKNNKLNKTVKII